MSKKKFIFILIVATLFAYFSSLGNPFIWDDDAYIRSNDYIQQFSVGKIFTTNSVAGAGQISNYYRPLTSLSWAIDIKIWGSNVFGFHLMNILLHLGCGLLLFYLLKKWRLSDRVAFLASLIFLVHPIQTEAVTYISSRGNSLSAFFLFLSLILFTTLLQKNSRQKIVLVVASLSCYLASIFSKESALFFFPLYGIPIFLDMYHSKKSLKTIGTRRETFMIGSYLFISILYVLLRATILNFLNVFNYAQSPDIYSQHIWVRLLTFSKVIWIYIELLFFPFGLHLGRTVSYVTTAWSIWLFATVCLFGCLMAISLLTWKKRLTPWIFIGFYWSCITLIPISGIITINLILAESWLYLPIIGLLFILYGILVILPLKRKKILYLASIFVVGIYIILTIRQNNLWSDPITFYKYELSFGESSAIENNLAFAYQSRGDYADAIKHYQIAVSHAPAAYVYTNLANAYVAEHKNTLAEQNYIKAYQKDSKYSPALLGLVQLYETEGKYNACLPILKKLEKEFIPDAGFELLYAKALWHLNKKDEAEHYFLEALKLSSDQGEIQQIIEGIEKGN